MAIAELYNSTGTTISTTEISLVSATSSLQAITTDGVYQILIDVAILAANDEFRFQVKEKVYGAGTQRVVLESTLVGQQASPVWVSPSLVLMHGWDATAIKVAGTDRSLAWSIRQVA